MKRLASDHDRVVADQWPTSEDPLSRDCNIALIGAATFTKMNGGLRIMKRMMMAAALAVTGMAAVPAQAATFTNDGGARSVGIAGTGPIGQSFAMVGTTLSSFGFQLQANNTTANDPLSFTLFEGEGLGGTALKQISLTAPDTALRTGFWQDFDLGGLTLADGRIYTAALSTGSTRLAVLYGPGTTGTVDAYTGGRLLTGTALPISNRSCTAGLCDTNFRFTSTGATGGAVPEPAAWVLLTLGFGAVGYTLRRARGSRLARQLV
jgi:hypothetical protein